MTELLKLLQYILYQPQAVKADERFHALQPKEYEFVI